MTATHRELVSRRAALLERCAAERSRLSEYAAPIMSVAGRIDDGIVRARRLASQPVVIIGVLMGMALLVRSRPLRWVSRTVGLASTAWRAGSVVTSLVSRIRKKPVPLRQGPAAGYSVEVADDR